LRMISFAHSSLGHIYVVEVCTRRMDRKLLKGQSTFVGNLEDMVKAGFIRVRSV